MRSRLIVSLICCCISVSFVHPALAQVQKPDELAAEKKDTDAAALNAQLEDLKRKHEDLLEQFDGVMRVAREDKLPLYRELAAVYMNTGAYEQAARAFESIVVLDRNNLQAHYQLGLIYARYIKDTPKALEHLKRCIALNKDEKIKKDAQYLVAMLED